MTINTLGEFKGPLQDSMSVRVFTAFEYQGTPDTNWDMKIEIPQWIHDVHNTRSGKCFIFGTGPSVVKEIDLLPKMVDEDTWTVNRMRLWGDLPFVPTHHVVAEPGPILNWGRQIHDRYDFPEALNRIAINWWEVSAPGWLWCPKAPDDIQMRWEGFFGLSDRFTPLPTGWASPLTAAQLACWMGHTEIYFLGIDTTQVGQVWDIEQGRTAQPRNIRSIMECFDRARADIQLSGRQVYDCSKGGRVNQEGALPFKSLEEALGL
jgi:hypothetical protein